MQDVGNGQNVGPGSTSNGSSTRDKEVCCSVLAHLLVDMWQRAGPATSFSLACVLLKRHALPFVASHACRSQASRSAQYSALLSIARASG